MQIIQMILKDNSAQTEIESAYALQRMQEENNDLFGKEMKYKPFVGFGPEMAGFEYRGHFCGSHDVLNTFYFDRSGVLERNVVAFYVRYPRVMRSEYYDVGRVRERFDAERSDKKVASAMEHMF